ncbi:MAG: YceI family protein [Elusimicrobiota bacterium]|nr:YceI family protein [Elusimicrobiota bacterium]
MRHLTLGALLLLALPAAASEVTLSPSSRLWLEGDSTLHPYSSTATAFTADFSFEAAGPLAAAVAAKSPAKLTVRVPVASLKSAHDGLDKNLRKTLKASEHPDIVFTMKSYAVSGASVTATGDLTVAGKSREVVLEARYEARDGKLFVEGAEPVLMTAHGIKPPTMFMGAVKTADLVTVQYRLVLEPAASDSKETK